MLYDQQAFLQIQTGVLEKAIGQKYHILKATKQYNTLGRMFRICRPQSVLPVLHTVTHICQGYVASEARLMGETVLQ